MVNSAKMKVDQSEFTGRHMLAITVSFFAIVILVNITMALLASGTWTGLVVKNSYVASQQFNEELKAARSQQQLGLNSSLVYEDRELVFILKDKVGNPLKVSNLEMIIGRPAFEQADRKLALAQANDHTHKLGLELEPGIWSIQITGKAGGHSYRRDARLFVSNDGSGRIE